MPKYALQVTAAWGETITVSDCHSFEEAVHHMEKTIYRRKLTLDQAGTAVPAPAPEAQPEPVPEAQPEQAAPAPAPASEPQPEPKAPPASSIKDPVVAPETLEDVRKE